MEISTAFINEGELIMIRIFFVLDFDGTYDNEDPDDYGVTPLVYLIPKEKQLEVEATARKAHDMFLEEGDDLCIGDYFEDLLTAKEIDFQRVGELKLFSGNELRITWMTVLQEKLCSANRNKNIMNEEISKRAEALVYHSHTFVNRRGGSQSGRI